MKEKFLLYLTDESATLYKGAHEKILHLKKDIKEAQEELQHFLSSFPKSSLSLLIDRSQEDLREEKLPSLFLWDRIRYLVHKKRAWAEEKGYVNYRIFKQEGETYLRSIHIPPHDSLLSWLLWMDSLPLFRKNTFIVPLEAEKFLNKHLSPSSDYQILFYSLSKPQIRHLVFKRKRLLLSRLSQKEDDFKASLHFLSRSYPDIYENLWGLSLVKEFTIDLPRVHVLPDRQALLHFISQLKRPTLSLNKSFRVKKSFFQMGGGLVFLTLLLGSGYFIYGGLHFKKMSQNLVKEIKSLKAQKQLLFVKLGSKNVSLLRQGLDSFRWLRHFQESPLEFMEKMTPLLPNQNLQLERFTWHQGKNIEMTLDVLMQNQSAEGLTTQLKALLNGFQRVFPKSKVYLLQAPFNSGSYETFKIPSNLDIPLAQIKVTFP